MTLPLSGRQSSPVAIGSQYCRKQVIISQFDEAWGHHGQVGEHVGLAEHGVEALHGVGDAAVGGLDGFVEGLGGGGVPAPGVLEGLDLAAASVPSRSAKRTL